MADYSKMKVVELKAELKRLGLPQNGLKAELVARLEEAAASEESPDATSEPPAEATTPTEPDEAQPPEDVAPENETSDISRVEPAQEVQAEPVTATAQDTSGNDAQEPQPSDKTTSETPPLPAAEVVQDVQKRKRRSTTPPPADEVVRKRLRQDDSDAIQDVDMRAVPDDEGAANTAELDEKEATISQEPANSVDEIEDTHAGRDDTATTEFNNSRTVDGRILDMEDSVMADAAGTSEHQVTHAVANDAIKQETRDSGHSPSPEPDIEPSIHPATCALYIKNFMRPLRPQAVQDHLLDLATPANTPLDPSIIVNFYLDNIRTHAFTVFATVSAASRVRTALHKRVWPDETNRKALWIDFIPPESFDEWIDIEQAKDKGNMPRYEVNYEHDSDGNVIANLEETDTNQATRRGPVSPIAHPDRKASIPTGPSRPSGIENAPTGPRNPYSHNGPPPSMYPGRQDIFEPGFVRTKTNPPVVYRPVSSELAQRRLDCLAQAKDPYYNEESGRDYHRYYFERDDVLVNRGPEIFLGIRPPHREKERRELARTGGDPRDRSFRDRRGPPGPPGPPGGDGGGGRGGGRRRRRAPRAHGVPRGGDRFRPGSSYNDRAPDDRRPAYRDDYGGGNRRKEGYRY
ncbi:hypothetical protein GGR51DRAFT_518419 [Nemania sp. FL0031]|nr:hypothetical protein GGR51DRAFT_518419 [Nemania sp. FL0031]